MKPTPHKRAYHPAKRRRSRRGREPGLFDLVIVSSRALESAGVEFIAENGGGPGVRLRKGGEGPAPKP
jgi:hypothetical protein